MLEIIYISSVFQITLFLYQISVYSDFSTVAVNYPKIICFSYENYGYFSLLSIKRRTKQESMYASINWDLSIHWKATHSILPSRMLSLYVKELVSEAENRFSYIFLKSDK